MPGQQDQTCRNAGQTETASSIGDIKKAFAAACRLAGLEDFHPHDLRHTCAAWLVQSGVPITEIRDLLRHSSVRMTERYAHLAPHQIREAVRVLEGASLSRSTFMLGVTGGEG